MLPGALAATVSCGLLKGLQAWRHTHLEKNDLLPGLCTDTQRWADGSWSKWILGDGLVDSDPEGGLSVKWEWGEAGHGDGQFEVTFVQEIQGIGVELV